MTIKTKSGFKCEISEKRIDSWNIIDIYSKIKKASDENDYSALIDLTRELYVFTLGEESYKALYEHLKDEDGITSAQDMTREFDEIMGLARAKKSKSSQA